MGVLMSLRWADSSEALVGPAFVVRAFGFLGGLVFDFIEAWYHPPWAGQSHLSDHEI